MTEDEIVAEAAVRQAQQDLADAEQRLLDAENEPAPGTSLCPFCGAVFGTCGHPQGVPPVVA